MMSHFGKLLFFLALALTGFPFSPCRGETSTADPTAAEILEKALQRADWYRENEIRRQLDFLVLKISEELNGEGRVEEKEELLYEPELVGEAVFEKLVEKNGRTLTAKEREEQRKRREEFQEKLAEGEDPEEDERVQFDEDLVDRYDWERDRLEETDEGVCYVLTFQPRSGDLPVENRMDRALNKAAGEVWIHRSTWEVFRVRFDLIEKIKIGWGILGSISEVTGEIRRGEVLSDLWMPRYAEFYLNGRIFFSSLHRREVLKWYDYEFREDQADSSRQVLEDFPEERSSRR